MSLSKNINPSLVLVQPRKTRPVITERLLMGCKASNQTNKQNGRPLFKGSYFAHMDCLCHTLLFDVKIGIVASLMSTSNQGGCLDITQYRK